jgi:hypothetical protein
MPPKKRTSTKKKRSRSSSDANRETPARKKANAPLVSPHPQPVSTGGSTKCGPAHIVNGVRHILLAHARYHDRWFISDDLVTIVKRHFQGLDDLTSKKLTNAIKNNNKLPFGGEDNMKKYTEGNPAGVYANQIEKNRKKIWCYLLTKQMLLMFLMPSTHHRFLTKEVTVHNDT